MIGPRLDQSQRLDSCAKRSISITMCRCVRCGLIFSNPQPVLRSVADYNGLLPEEYSKLASYEPMPRIFSGQVDAAKRLLTTDGSSAHRISASDLLQRLV